MPQSNPRPKNPRPSSGNSNKQGKDRFTAVDQDEYDSCSSQHSLSALNCSTISTGTKTALNTLINAVVTAPKPVLSQPSTMPEMFSPVNTHCIIDDLQDTEGGRSATSTATNGGGINGMNISTPPSGCSSGSGEVVVDVTKFGSPATRRLIMEDARSNVIWEASADDDEFGLDELEQTPARKHGSTQRAALPMPTRALDFAILPA